jgi:adenylate cyclase
VKVKLIFILLFITCGTSILYAQPPTEESLQKAFLTTKDDTTARRLIEELMFLYYTDKSHDDSFQKLQLLIQKRPGHKLSYMIPMLRIALTHTPDSIVETRKVITQFLSDCRKLDQKKDYATGLIQWSQRESYAGNYNEALKLLLHSLDYVRDTLNDKKLLGGVYMTLGIFYFDQRDTLQAIAANKKALGIATEIRDIEDIASVSNNLAMLYNDVREYDSAKVYYRNSISHFNISDRGGLLSNPLINLAEVFRLTHQYDSAIIYARKSIRHAIDHNYNESVGAGYWRIAQIFHSSQRTDSAATYYKLATTNIETYQPQSALIGFYPDLASFYASTGNHQLAYDYLQKATVIKDQIFNSENNQVLKEMDVKYQASQKEKEILKQEEQIKRQRIMNYSMIAVAGFFLSMVFFIYRSYRLKHKANIIITNEKKRSDELLLNILPSEVAEELKAKGSADAKQFDDVTVMFTDFKNFTQISEKLSPTELVAEIHTCFKAFDNIIDKHNIEKIKTIGDSYMCAGGLPVANTTNATDVVIAAIEIQSFMQDHMQKRLGENKDPFEIRIGVHTGAVVAGIVGVKKFAYDIWGDTVNVASRMESSGEAGKVNISGATYDLVKDKFRCVHRGKIQAKNKGEVDMYFVEA